MIRRTLFALFLAAQTALAADASAFLDAWFAAQKNVHSWSADFTQTRRLKTLTQPLTTPGRLRFAAPDDFRWELGQPAETIALRRDNDLFLIYPRLKRAEHYALGGEAPRQWRDAMALLNAGFPQDRAQFEAQFDLRSLAQTNGQWRLDLRPRARFARQFMPALQLRLGADYSLASVNMIFVDGSSMQTDFSNAAMNPPLDAALFQWSPPPDFTVVNPLAQ